MDEETQKQLAQQYQTSIEDIRFFKSTQWRISSTCYVIFGTIIWAGEKLGNLKCISYLLIVVVAVCGVRGVKLTDNALNNTRDVIRNIRKKYTDAAKEVIGSEYIDETRGSDRGFFAWIFYVAIGIAALVTGLIIFNAKPN